MSISENERYWQHRAQRAEAECERLRADMQAICDESRALRQGGPFAEDALELHDALERAVEIAANAQTPPPEGEPPTRDKPKWDPKRLSGNRMLRNPEDAARDVSNFAAPQTPEQAHGDALAALVDEIAPPIAPFNNEAEEEEYHCESAVRHYSERVREKLRRHLTASGVPEDNND